MTDQAVLEEYDLNIGAEAVTSSATGREPEHYQEGRILHGLVPGSKRFLAFSSLGEAFCIWDEATQRVVRSADAGK